jgi:hypothetical protein
VKGEFSGGTLEESTYTDATYGDRVIMFVR